MKLLVIAALLLSAKTVSAQADTIFIKGNQQILCSHIKDAGDLYRFRYLNSENREAKSSILKYLVDSVKYFSPVADSSATVKSKRKKKNDAEEIQSAENAKTKPWKFTTSIGSSLGNLLEFNNPSGTDSKNLSFNFSSDLGLNYKKEGKKFEMTNELHYLFGIQKEGLAGGTHIQRVQDDLSTLHDLSSGFGKHNKWNFNLILKTATPLFTVYDGEYFKNFTTLGRIKAFASPYDISVAPGIKFAPDDYLRISFSPYSFQLYGVNDNEVSGKGIFITDLDASGNYKHHLFKRLGAEINFWYDRKFKEWLELQYRLAFSSDYFANFGKNGLMDGLFITKIKLMRDVYLTHRSSIKSNLAVNFLKPFYSQSLMLSYSKSF